jgi:hypothetical protein
MIIIMIMISQFDDIIFMISESFMTSFMISYTITYDVIGFTCNNVIYSDIIVI